MAQVERVKTPITVTDAARYVRDTLTAVLGRLPSRELAEFVLALVWVETGRGQSMVGNSPGNVMARGIRNGKEYSVWSGDYWRPTWWDANWSNKEMREGRWPSAFRAYPSMAAGFKDYVSNVVKRAPLVAAMQSGDPMKVVLALNSTRYSPDYGPKHEPTFRGLVQGFRKDGLFAGLPSSSGSASGAVLGCVALFLGGIALAWWRAHR